MQQFNIDNVRKFDFHEAQIFIDAEEIHWGPTTIYNDIKENLLRDIFRRYLNKHGPCYMELAYLIINKKKLYL